MPEEIDRQRLARGNGKDGNPVYIAHKGKVYDVTASPLWMTGTHMNMHQAGGDLTAEIGAAPHGTEVLERYPQIGILSTEGVTKTDNLPVFVAAFLSHHPFFRRHLHPVAVHFPIVFTLSFTFFTLLYAIVHYTPFLNTAFYLLIAALIFMVPAMITGFLTWWINYMARPMSRVRVKIVLSFVAVALLVALLIWSVFAPALLNQPMTLLSLLYMGLAVAASVAVLIVGYEGGLLTFPLETT